MTTIALKCVNETTAPISPYMDESTQKAVTNALDSPIATVADQWFTRISKRLIDKEIATKIHGALVSLRDLRYGKMPQYDEWDALFYILWYQPAHINMAYTLARTIPKDVNPLLSSNGNLEVFDFGRGALAMNFGLSLASSDFCRKTPPRIFVTGHDSSESMEHIGWAIWDYFIEEMCNVKRYPELRSLRRVCFNMKCERKANIPAKRWLTALHVAYAENFELIRDELDCQVDNQHPDLILVTTYPGKSNFLYHPSSDDYCQNSNFPEIINASNLILKGEFPETTSFRKNLWHNRVDVYYEHLSLDESDLVHNYLTKLPTTWNSKFFDSVCATYSKDSLPF